MKNGCSDRLYNDEAESVEEMFDLYEGQISEELDPFHDDPECAKAAREMRASLAIARALYPNVNAMATHEDEGVREIARAIKERDYSILAI